MWLLLLSSSLLGCTDPVPEKLSDYSTHAAPTLRTHCTACHGALSADGGVRLHTSDLASDMGSRALVRMSEGSMPPGGGVSQREIQAFSHWLDQGMPGESAEPLPVDLPVAGLDSFEVDATLSELSPGRFEVVWLESYSMLLFASEVWLLQDSALYLEERRTDQQVDRWDPPLRIFDPTQESWTQDTQHSRTDALGEGAWSERWTAESWDVLDARAADQEALGSWIVEEGGASMGFQAGELSLVARSILDPESGGIESMLVRSPNQAESLLIDGLVWVDRVILWP